MSWLPALVFVASSSFPVLYQLTGDDRNAVGWTGLLSLTVPILGLVVGSALLFVNLGSLLARPVRLFVTVVSGVQAMVVIAKLGPRVVGASLGQFVATRLFGR